MRSPLLSPLGKLRMLLDLVIPPRQGDADETLADFIRRRFGEEALLKLAEPLLSDPVVVLNGDILADLDLSAMLRFHRERGARATLYLTRVSDPTQYGLVELEPDGAIRAFVEKPEPDRVTTDTVNAGVYALDRSVVTAIPTGRAVRIPYIQVLRFREGKHCAGMTTWTCTRPCGRRVAPRI